jgi:hypothetical protein
MSSKATTQHEQRIIGPAPEAKTTRRMSRRPPIIQRQRAGNMAAPAVDGYHGGWPVAKDRPEGRMSMKFARTMRKLL